MSTCKTNRQKLYAMAALTVITEANASGILSLLIGADVPVPTKLSTLQEILEGALVAFDENFASLGEAQLPGVIAGLRAVNIEYANSIKPEGLADLPIEEI